MSKVYNKIVILRNGSKKPETKLFAVPQTHKQILVLLANANCEVLSFELDECEASIISYKASKAHIKL